MTKRLLKIISILACVLLLFSSVVGCKKSTNSSNAVRQIYNDGIHTYNITQTVGDNHLVKADGTSDYKVVIPSSAGKWLKFAADELVLFFKEATNINLPIVVDSETINSNTGKYIVLGCDNTLFTDANLVADKDVLDRHGFIIKTVADDIYIAGAYDDGTNFGVYAFLRVEFNYDCFNDSVYHIDTGVKNLKLKNYDVVDVPDLKVRFGGNWFHNNSTALRRMGFVNRNSGDTCVGSPSSHTVFTYLNPNIYKVEHPYWFASDGTQLCYTARGDAKEYAAMQAETLELIKSEFIKNTNGYLCIFSQEDKYAWCTCEECSDTAVNYNKSNAAVIIKFINELADNLEAWMNTEEGLPYKRDFKLLFLAYDKTVNPPSVYNKQTGKYEAIDDTVICNDNVAPIFAPIQMDYQQSIFAEDNESFKTALDGWRPLSNNFNFYTYQCNYDYYAVPFNMWNNMRDSYQLYASLGGYWFFDEGYRKAISNMTGWHMLKVYVTSKLAWDVNIDIDATVDKFFTYYYGPASQVMRDWYNEWRVHVQNLIDHQNFAMPSSVFQVIMKREYYPSAILDRWLNKVDTAFSLIEDVKYTDYDLYTRYYDAICLERISLNYMLIELYEEDYEKDYILKLKLDTKNDMLRLDADQIPSNVSSLFTKWGID
ncbi:MAG: DUF4838 domain-containing protein [Clostridia bacterium]|nr:DUF4838 domain-containing protein [Clostridia bacterium]